MQYLYLPVGGIGVDGRGIDILVFKVNLLFLNNQLCALFGLVALIFREGAVVSLAASVGKEAWTNRFQETLGSAWSSSWYVRSATMFRQSFRISQARLTGQSSMDLRGFFSLVGSGGRGQQKVEHCVVKEAAGQVSSHFEKKSPGSAVLYVPLKHRRKLINFRRDFDRFYRFFYTP